MAKKKSGGVLNIKKRWLRRTYISTAEFLSGIALSVVIILSGLWFFTRKDQYDPQERDLDPTLLAGQSTLELYNRPLKVWQELGSANSEPKAANLGPFPEGVLTENWLLEGRVRQFEPDNLFEKINGEAPKFLSKNFLKLHYLVLKSSEAETEIAIELFDHQDVTSSIGIFSGHMGGYNEVLNLGPVSYFETGAGLIGRKGAYFFRIAASDFNDAAKEKILQLAQAFSNLNSSADEFPMEYSVLNKGLDIPGGSISYVGENVFQYDFADNFWFGALQSGEDAQAFVHAAASEEESAELYQLLLTELEFDYEVVESSDNTAILKHRFLNTFFVMQRKDPYLFGVDKLEDQNKISSIMSMLAEGISEHSSL